MKWKVITILLVLISLSCLYMGTAKASVSPIRTYEFVWGVTTGGSFGWNVTAPIYAGRGTVVTLTFESYVYATVNFGSPLRFEVTATLDGETKQQLNYSQLIAAGSHGIGYNQSYTPSIRIPSNAMLGSSLNVSVYTDLNKWEVFPTEIRDMNYDDLQSAYNNAQNQINTLNQQVANLTTDKNTLNQQIADLKAQTSLQSLTIPLAMGAVTIVAVTVAIYMFHSKRKLTRAEKQS